MVEFSQDEMKKLEKGDNEVKEWVLSHVFKEEEWPKIPRKDDVEGEALVEANPILGIEKYLGMVDSAKRIAYFPSLKLTNDSFRTKTYIRFDKSLKDDVVIFGDRPAEGKELKRFNNILNVFREMTGIRTKCVVVSRHIPKVPAKGKGLGLSASASGAVAKALVESVLPEVSGNNRFLSVLARFLSGSGTSSAAGGFSVWFSHPGIRSEDSYAVRIDKDVDIKLVVVPIPAMFKTESAHKAAVKSPLYKYWALSKAGNVMDLMECIRKNDIEGIGRHAENDALNLFHLLVTGDGFFNWEPFSLDIARKVVLLRRELGLTAYFTMDTGPSVAILTNGKDAESVKEEVEKFIRNSGKDYPVYIAEPMGEPRKLDLSEREEIITPDVISLLKQRGVEIE
ncbi:MAG: hypothetical protein J7K72_05295 [Candidatus Aenigmarchaeota archaeon]|nr:hypothetical protein [Candidatus Aenigmarchaeota archaeon]